MIFEVYPMFKEKLIYLVQFDVHLKKNPCDSYCRDTTEGDKGQVSQIETVV